MNATSSASVISVFQYPNYTSLVTGSGTETVTFSNTNRGSANATIGGTPTTGDVVSIVAHNAALSGGAQTASYTVADGDTLLSISQGLAAAINANTGLKALGVTGGTAATLAWSQSFSGKTPLANGANLSAVSATDGSNNTKTNDHQVGINGGSASTLTFDANGNMTSDATNTYKWDAENRLIQINYPGTGNYSVFVYDAYDRNIKIAETLASNLVSTRQFVWSKSDRCENRNAVGAVSSQYLSFGQTVASSNFFYTRDHLGSVREVTSNAGSVEAQYAYSSEGNVIAYNSTLASDYQYAGYYKHASSQLNLTLYRAYDSSLGRWINRDPAGETPGLNLYTYVFNDPTGKNDPTGLTGSPPANRRKCCFESGCYGRCCEFYKAGALTQRQYQQCLSSCDNGFDGCPYPYNCSCACWWMWSILQVISDQEYRGCVARCKSEYGG